MLSLCLQADYMSINCSDPADPSFIPGLNGSLLGLIRRLSPGGAGPDGSLGGLMSRSGCSSWSSNEAVMGASPTMATSAYTALPVNASALEIFRWVGICG